jgi:hypothetical protein
MIIREDPKVRTKIINAINFRINTYKTPSKFKESINMNFDLESVHTNRADTGEF